MTIHTVGNHIWSRGGDGKTPVDSLVNPILQAAREWLAEPEADNGAGGELPIDEITALISGLVKEVDRLEEDRQWQIKQNVKMLTALDRIAKHLKLPCDQRDDGVLEQLTAEGMTEAV